jgi:3-oxoacyl-[acyl-carrier protein] reductase
VTGASRGIGRGIAEFLAADGATVICAARGDHAAGTVEAIRAAGGAADQALLDVTDRASIDTLVAAALERYGKIDVLVINAGIARDQLMLRMKREDWDEVVATNLTAAFGLVQAVLKPMIRQRGGRIVSISSVVGQMGNAGQANYAAAKAGLEGFSRALAREIGSRNITVNAVAPGFIATDMTHVLPEEQKEKLLGSIPAGRLGQPEEIAAAVGFLASAEASYITGVTLHVNGGMYME